ncbi:TPA: acyltransferase family protein [Proteus mirabilis]|uniref:acyltransferase family protein n=1 Tax=Proteus TaxID=583 RepID=UPI000D68ED61|nr:MULTISPECIES: acyltransferase [Proteus]ELT0936290.1 acyltransferase [Proteus mirabilis]MBI6496742.1 acyltransferase [Proteus mirabilis]MCW9720555.1 acyltransferase [Proteus mirabilis]HEK0600286.1 acyltransferase [Proteus mirabilis]
MNGEIKTIQYLRGIAALAVVLFHYRFTLNEFNQFDIKNLGNILFSSGSFGVDLFFMISGFVITLSTKKDYGRRKNLIKFSLKRFFRIYPLLIVCVLIASYIYNSDIKSIIKSLIPIHLQYNYNAPFFGLNVLMVAWTLTFELFFYLLFMLSIIVNHKYRGVVCCLLIVSLFSLVRIVYTGEISLIAYKTIEFDYPTIITAPLSLISSPMILEFCLGIISFYIYEYIKNLKTINISFLKPIFICCIFYLFILCFSKNEFTGHGIMRWGGICFLLLTLCVIYELLFGVGNFKSLNFLGDISYSLYMTHQLSAILLASLSAYLYLTGFPKFINATLGAIAIASISYIIIEKPFIRISKKYTSN